jgi:hypothetical protein
MAGRQKKKSEWKIAEKKGKEKWSKDDGENGKQRQSNWREIPFNIVTEFGIAMKLIYITTPVIFSAKLLYIVKISYCLTRNYQLA